MRRRFQACEAVPGVWNGTRKHFFSPRIFSEVVHARNSPGPASTFNCLTLMHLNFTNKEYFDFFGVKQFPFRLESEGAIARCLTKLPQLQDLQLRFRHPFDGYAGSPWFSHRGPLTTRRTGCQKTVVDWIVAFAFLIIKDIRKVSLTGYIKT